jgi:hypothetical protein
MRRLPPSLIAKLAVHDGWVLRRNQRLAELDEGVWHEAPSA